MTDVYESDTLLDQYLRFHYSTYEDYFPHDFDMRKAFNFPVRCAIEGPDYDLLNGNERVLDVGCSVGRSSFELSKYFSSVVGIDFSHSFINAALELKNKGACVVHSADESGNKSEAMVHLDASIIQERVHFESGDAQDLREDLGYFDLVIACNLICRLPQPLKFLDRLPQLVKPGGQLFMTTPFTWLEEYTPKENWLSHKTGDSFQGLCDVLDGSFKLLKNWDMPFLIRDHSRKFQFSIAQASRWQRLEL